MKRGRGRPPVGTVIEKKPVALHWVRVASLNMDSTLCGQPLSSVQVAGEFAEVTCKQCKRLGIANPQHQAKPRRVDSLMMRAFNEADSELRARIEAVRLAIAATSPDAYEGGEVEMRACMSQLLIDVCTEAKALVDLLDPPTGN